MRKAIKLGLLLLALTPLAGCESIPAATVASCGSWLAISVSKEDVLTEGTASQIKGNNVAHAAVCGKKSKG